MKLCDDSKLLFAKVKPNAVIPSKREEDGGFDVYACFDEEYIVIEPHTTKMIPTGLASAFTSEWVVLLQERGSTGTKGIAGRCGVIDSGFRSEWFVVITNTNEIPIIIAKKSFNTDALVDDFIIYPYEKAICQALVVRVPRMEYQEVSYEELLTIESQRGAGSLGSSNK